MTSIDKLSQSLIHEELLDVVKLTEEDLVIHVENECVCLSNRIACLLKLFEVNPVKAQECIFFASSKLIITETETGRLFMLAIVKEKQIPLVYRVEIVKNLYTTESKRESILEIHSLLLELTTIIPPPYFTFMILLAFLTVEKGNNVSSHIYWLCQSNIDSEVLFRSIRSLSFNEEFPPLEEYIRLFYKLYRDNEKFLLKFRILSCQNLLIIKEEYNDCLQFLFKYAKDKNIEYNIRADLVDILLKHTVTDEEKQEALSLLKELSQGTKEKRVLSIYDNFQNAHDENISESVKQFLLQLGNIIITLPAAEVYDKVREEAKIKFQSTLNTLNTNLQKIDEALTRIQLDSEVYPASQTLESIFVRVWIKINNWDNLEYQSTLKQRLFEELIDMAGTCGSGHTDRLANVFSGFDFQLNIGFEKQICARLLTRINKLITSTTGQIVVNESEILNHRQAVKFDYLEDKSLSEPSPIIQDKQERILEELTQPDFPEDRKFLKELLRENFDILYNELKDEYNDCIPSLLSNNLFDEYFRKSMYFFETGSKLD